MILLVHSAPATLAPYALSNVGILSSPRRFYRDVEGWTWAADNDAYSAWDADRFRRMVDGISGLPGCLFVTSPDVVGDAARTAELFEEWRPFIVSAGLPVALVSQDGLEEPPWEEFDALFIGGSTVWKMSAENERIVREAKERGKWVHMGRVNGHRRIRYAKAIGCDSMDGTSLSWFRDRWLVEYAEHAAGETQLMVSA